MNKLFSRIENIFNINIRFPRDDRMGFYEILVTQLDAGMTLDDIFKALSHDIKISDEVQILARLAYTEVMLGHNPMAVLEKSNLLPIMDCKLLTHAYGDQTLLPTVLNDLLSHGKVNRSFFVDVVLPNTYYFVILGMLLGIVLQVGNYIDVLPISTDLSEIHIYWVSEWLNEWLSVLIGGLVVGGSMVYYLCCHSDNSLRRYVWFFHRDIDLQYGASFCSMASTCYSAGMTNDKVLDVAGDIFAHSGYMRKGLAKVKQALTAKGKEFNIELGGTVLLPEIALYLQAMAPEDNRKGQKNAHRAVEKLQLTILAKRHSKAKSLLQALLMSAIGYFILQLLFGMYNLVIFPT